MSIFAGRRQYFGEYILACCEHVAIMWLVHYGVAGNIRSERKPFEPDQDNPCSCLFDRKTRGQMPA